MIARVIFTAYIRHGMILHVGIPRSILWQVDRFIISFTQVDWRIDTQLPKTSLN